MTDKVDTMFNHRVKKSNMINPMSDSHAHLREQLEEYQTEVYTPNERVTATRWIEISDKKWTIQRCDPHGFWNILPPPGMSLPKDLSGRYTMPKDAQKSIEHFVNTSVLEPAGKVTQKSRVRRRRTEIPAAETVEAINL